MQLPAVTIRRFQRRSPACAIVEETISSLSDYLAVFSAVLAKDRVFWFRGHSDYRYELVPAALRHPNVQLRNRALSLVSDFRRYAEIKVDRIPTPDDDLYWVQLAQHYGLGSRLLDWTENAAVDLYFACQRSDRDGAVYILNPETLNLQSNARMPYVLDVRKDKRTIARYIKLDGKETPRGLPTIAIHPVYNSERIVLQKGAFTLYGSRAFGLDRTQEPSLVKVPILKKYKLSLLVELERIGVGEMTVFPELEHVCSHLKRRAKLV